MALEKKYKIPIVYKDTITGKAFTTWELLDKVTEPIVINNIQIKETVTVINPATGQPAPVMVDGMAFKDLDLTFVNEKTKIWIMPNGDIPADKNFRASYTLDSTSPDVPYEEQINRHGGKISFQTKYTGKVKVTIRIC